MDGRYGRDGWEKGEMMSALAPQEQAAYEAGQGGTTSEGGGVAA